MTDTPTTRGGEKGRRMMDASGTIYSECKKCGETVVGDRACWNCGEPSGTADTLAAWLRDAIVDEVPDPLARMREGLISEHKSKQLRRRAFKKGRKPTLDEEPL